MTDIFLHLVNMSITAGWIVLAVALLRLMLRKAPRWMLCLLWSLVGIRLLFPISIESVLSLIPSKETIPPEILYSPTPEIHTGISTFNNVVNPVISETFAPEAGASVNPMQIVLGISANIWLAGILLMLLYTLVSYLRLKGKVRISMPTEKGVCICDNINTPFILGIIKPTIYLPSTLSAEDSAYVLAHEKAHIKRKDHLWKPLGFLLLTVYWFNPLLWLGYILLCRDIELACDEKVLRDTADMSKKDYSTALLNCSVPRKMIAACPLAFGEVGVKQRIKNILNYKKPAFWIICIALIASIVASVCLLTNPVTDKEKDLSAQVLSSGSDIEGVSLEIVDLNLEESLSDNSYIEIKWKNENNESYTCGEPFNIFKKVDGEWVDIRKGDAVFTTIGYMIPKKGEFSHKYSLWNIEIDTPGEYRFTSTFLRDKGDTTPKQYNAWIDFEVTELPSARDYSFAVTKQGSDRYGINLDLVRVNTQSLEPFIEVRWDNTLDYDISANNDYKIYKQNNSKWELLSAGNYVWEETANILPANGSFTKKYSLEGFDIGTITQNGKFRFECSIASNNEKVWVEFYYPLTKSTVASSYVSSDLSGLSVEVQDMNQTLYDGKEYLSDKSKIKIKWTNQSGKDLTTTSDQFIDLYKNVNGIWVDMTLVKKKIYPSPSDTDFVAIEAINLENNTSKIISHTLFGKRLLEDGEYKLAANFVTESGSRYTANVYFQVGKATPTNTSDVKSSSVAYYCNDAQEAISGTRPELRLYPNESRFELMLSALSSYLPTGTYHYEGDKLILEADYGNKYVFRVNEGGTSNTLTDETGTTYSVMTESFTFIADESTELPKYKYNANEKAKYPFEDGAVFEIDEDVFTGDPTSYVYDSISYDIDSDGVKEDLSLTMGPTYGTFTMSLVVKENDREESRITFYDCYGIHKFLEKGNKLYLTSDADYEDEPRFVEITYDNGIVMRENGFRFGDVMEYPTEQVANVINAYIEGYKTHDVELLNSILSEDMQFDTSDREFIDALIGTVTDCKLITADIELYNILKSTVNITYEITYNDDYKPVGMREKGKNIINTVFTVEAINSKYLITDTGIELVEKTN